MRSRRSQPQLHAETSATENIVSFQRWLFGGPPLNHGSDAVDLHADVARQAGGLDCRTGGRVVLEIARVNGVHLGEFFHVLEVDSPLDHPVQRGTPRFANPLPSFAPPPDLPPDV